MVRRLALERMKKGVGEATDDIKFKTVNFVLIGSLK